MKTLYVIDSYALIYRSYFALINRPLKNKKQENISAIHGFFKSLLSLIKKNDVEYIVACMDSRTPTFRHEMYADYKAQRKPTPEDLHAQVPVIEEILEALGVKILRQDGFEADDIIATISEKCNSDGWKCRILSGDKDLMQLVNENTTLLKSDKTYGWEEIGVNEVEKEWGVKPDKMLDILSLTGDAADNIPGVKGIGDKTAIKLLSEYGSLDAILENAANISGSVGKKLQDGIDDAKFSRSLVKLRYDVPIRFQIEDFSFKKPNFKAAAKKLFHFELYDISKRYEEYFEKNDSPLTTEIVLDEIAPDEICELTVNTGNYSAVLDSHRLNEIIDDFLQQNDSDDGRIYVAFDTETDGLDVINGKLAGFSLCQSAKTSFYVPLVTQETKNSYLGELFAEKSDYVTQDEAFCALKKLFFNPNVTMVLHNAKFDLQILSSNGFFGKKNEFDYTCRIADTMIASWLLQSEKQSNSLEKLAETKLHLKTISFESIVPDGKTFMDVPLETAVKYGAEDSDLTIQLWNLFKGQLQKNNLMELFEKIEMPLIPLLAKMELTGIHIEKAELAEYNKELTSQIKKVTQEIYTLTGHEFNIASTKQLADVLFVEKGLPKTKNKKDRTDAEVLEELSKLDPLPVKVLEYRKLTKLRSTYVVALPKLADKNDRLHTSFLQTGTATGRLSSCNPNLQNIPVKEESGRRIRQAFSATKGNVLISADYSQIELVILAHLSKDENLCKAFNNGTDVHKETASLVFGVPKENVTAEMRRMAKTINFGVVYGMSAFRLSNTLDIPRQRAQEFINQYFATYSGVQSFMTKTIEDAEKNGYVETVFGRRRYIKAINSVTKAEKSSAERMAINTPIQGSAADIVKKAMLDVSAMLKSEFPEAKLLLQVHDELIAECPENIATNVAEKMKIKMENVILLNVPLKVSVEIGKRWGEFH